MDRNKLIALLQEKKIQDYSFTIIFFLIFSLFVIFAIRPNLITAFNLQKELQEIKLQNRLYEEQILQIINYQSIIEQYRDQFYLLDEAIPDKPQIADVIEDVQAAAAASNMPISSITADPVDFNKDTGGNLTAFKVTMEVTSPLSDVELLLTNLIKQRRIKTLNEISIETLVVDETPAQSVPVDPEIIESDDEFDLLEDELDITDEVEIVVTPTPTILINTGIKTTKVTINLEGYYL